jgi:hypothetical protein
MKKSDMKISDLPKLETSAPRALNGTEREAVSGGLSGCSYPPVPMSNREWLEKNGVTWPIPD